MGCWNATCALSGLPIQNKAKVKVLIVTEVHEANFVQGSCNVNDSLVALFLPITGTYNETGSIKGIHNDEAAKFTWRKLRKSYKLQGSERKLSHLKAITNLGTLCAAIERGCVYRHKRPLGLIHILDSVWQEVVAHTGTLRDSYFKMSYNDLLAKWYATFSQAPGKNPCEDYFSWHPKERRKFERLIEYIRGRDNSWHIPDFNTPQLPFIREFYLIHKFMDFTHRCWVAPSGKGSSALHYDSHIFMANLTAQHATQELTKLQD
jgi:hypothetical protein